MSQWTRRRPGRRAGVVAALLLVMAGCSGVPGSGQVNDIRAVGDVASPAQPQAPRPGQLPDQIVRGFIQAGADSDSDPKAGQYAVAKQFLTAAARRSWQTGTTPVIVLDDLYRLETDAAKSTVTMTGVQMGELATDRSYKASPSNTPFKVSLHLQRVAGEWRISDPPAQVLIQEQDLDRAFVPRTVYFLDPTTSVVVPDPRYLESGLTPKNRVSRLVDLLIGGPSGRLRGAAASAFGAGASLRDNVTTDDQGVVHVDLTDMTTIAGDLRSGLAAQLVWTLYPDASRIAISIDGEPLGATTPASGVSVYTLQSVDSYNPDRVAGTGQVTQKAWYLDPSGAVLSLADDRTPMWGSVGTGSHDVVSAALSAATGSLAAVINGAPGNPTGNQLLLGRPLDHVAAEPVLAAGSISQPSFTRTGDAVWVVQNGAATAQIIEITTTGTPARAAVSAPELAGKGKVTQLVLSPDGVRVALVAGGRLYVGVVVDAAPDQSGNGKSTTAIRSLSEIAPGLTNIGPVAFAAANQLVVGAAARTGQRILYQVGIDGRQLLAGTTNGLYGDVTAVSVAAGQPPLMSWGNRVYQLDGAWTSGQWIAPLKTEALPGADPFYPG